MAYNIKQENKSTVVGKPSMAPPKSFKEPNAEFRNGKYEIEMVDTEQLYVVAVDDKKIIKLGYCCENRGHIYPIFLKMNGKWEIIHIGKEGMYEMQPETFKDVNELNSEESISDVVITSVAVPVGIDFTLDYVFVTT